MAARANHPQGYDFSMQLTFDLPGREALGSEDFLVGPSNAAAVALIDRWPAQWAGGAAVITGPEGSGKTHLANVWRLRSGAVAVEAGAFTIADVGDVPHGSALVVENLDRGIASETALFHVLNLVREARIHVLLTARQAPGDLAIGLPDLRSRLRALEVAVIEPPDDALLSGVLVKLFSDRQLAVEPAVVSFMLTRMERSMTAARRIVGEIDRLALATHRKVTKQLVTNVLSGTGGSHGEP